MRILKWAAALSLVAAAGAANANECELTIDANDRMQFTKAELSAPASCEKVTVTLNHVGTLPATTMGHNWVLTKTADVQAVAVEGMGAADTNYVKEGDARVLAHTTVIGGGESTSVTFETAGLEAGGDYTFFCSFPGHFAVMQGKFKLN